MAREKLLPRSHRERNRYKKGTGRTPIFRVKSRPLTWGLTPMWLRIGVAAAVLALCGCAGQRESYFAQRDAPDLAFKGPLRPVSLSSAQIKLVQQGIAANVKDLDAASFGKSYRAATNTDGEIVVCGYVDGKKFAGMFAKSARGKTTFLPIGVGLDQVEEDSVKQYCRDDGIYMPQ